MSGLTSSSTPPNPPNPPPDTDPARAATGNRAEVAATLAIIGAVVLYAVARPLLRRLAAHPTQAECAELLDRYVDHLAHAADPRVAASAVAEAQRTARTRAANEPEFARCTTTLTREEADCAMHAQGADEFERCLP